MLKELFLVFLMHSYKIRAIHQIESALEEGEKNRFKIRRAVGGCLGIDRRRRTR